MFLEASTLINQKKVRLLQAAVPKMDCLAKFDYCTHGLRTTNEGINQRFLKNRADVADKICFGRTKKFWSGSEFSAVQ